MHGLWSSVELYYIQMLQQNPERVFERLVPSRLPAIEQAEVDRGARRGRRVLAKLAIGMALITGMSGFHQDVLANKEIQATATPTVEILAEPMTPEGARTGLVFMHGFGTIDADYLGESIGPAAQQMTDGYILSVGYENANLDEVATAEVLMETADNHGIEEFMFFGYSGGFIMSTKVAAETAEQRGPQTAGLIAIAAPDGLDTVRASQAAGVELLNIFRVFPDLAYSTPVRKFGELAFRSDRYIEDGLIDVPAMWRTWETVNDVVDRDKLPGTWLMLDQLALIETADIQGNFQTILNASPYRLRPTVSYFATAQPGVDEVVKDRAAAEAICGYAVDAGIECYQYDVAGAVHNRIDLGGEGYAQAFLEARGPVQGSIARAQDERKMAIGRLMLPPVR